MNAQRHCWMEQMLARENRIVDTHIMASLQNGTAFFASTSLIAIGGALTLFRSTDDVLTPSPRCRSGSPRRARRLGDEDRRPRRDLRLRLLQVRLVLPALQLRRDPDRRGAGRPRRTTAEAKAAARRAAAMNIVAGRHFNRGQRAFFFALAYLGWFISPYADGRRTAAVLLVMWRRQFASDAIKALEG